MTDLQQLICRYISGSLPYAEFRKEFVMRHLSVRNPDPAVEEFINAIEVACADLELECSAWPTTTGTVNNCVITLEPQPPGTTRETP